MRSLLFTMTEDTLCLVLASLDTEDLVALCAAGTQGRALVERFLKMQHGRRFQEYMECSIFRCRDDCASLLRFVAPMANRASVYVCGVCGGPTSTVAECPCRYLNFFFVRSRRPHRHTRHNSFTLTASTVYFFFLVLSACGSFGWQNRELCCVFSASILYFSFMLSTLSYSRVV